MPKITIRNLDTEINRRIKLVKTQASIVEVGTQDGAVSEQSDSVHICLSPFGSVDHAYLELYSIASTSAEEVKINDTVINPPDGATAFQIYPILREHGIAVYNTYDIDGCLNIYRVQNLTDEEINILMKLNSADSLDVVNKLEPQENQTIELMDLEGFGYKSIGFKIDANQGYIANDYVDSIISARLGLYKFTDSFIDDPDKYFKYKIELNDSAVLNPITNDIYFEFSTEGADSTGYRGLVELFNNNSLIMGYLEDNADVPYMFFTPRARNTNQVVKFRIIQEPVDSSYAIPDENKPMVLENFHWNNLDYVGVSPEQIIVDFYLFDPLNIDY